MLLKNSKGFSLIEILIALTLLAIAGTFTVNKLFQRLHEGKVDSAKIIMGNIYDGLQNYRRLCYSYPTTDQGLEALVSKPSGGRECKKYPPDGFLEEIPLDPWDTEFVYESDGKNFFLFSTGEDGEEEGEGNGVDIFFKDKKPERFANSGNEEQEG